MSKKIIDRTNIDTLTPGEIEAGLGVGFNLVDKGLDLLILLGNKIAEGIQQGPRIRRIRTLEEFAKNCTLINQQQTAQIEELKKQISELKNK